VVKKSWFKKGVIFFLILLVGFLSAGYFAQKKLLTAYKQQNSVIISDRNGQEIFILPNQKGNFARYSEKIPEHLKELLIKKEDKYFYYHFGFNPISIFRAGLSRLGFGQKKASSTISQQLVKILLLQESERNLKNKAIESFYTLALETFQSKEEILKMYANSIYLGNQVQGINEASLLYFGLTPDLLDDGQLLPLLATISSPTENNPEKDSNKNIALFLGQRLGIKTENINLSDIATIKKNAAKNSHSDDLSFELASLADSKKSQKVTIDKEINEKIREIVKKNIETLQAKNANNAAVIIIKLPENEILSLVGSPDPTAEDQGYKINMLEEPRPIGSTIKPFIYLNAFEKGLRPYTLVDDREYKYITALGFPLYPKNFDYQYRGEVTLHYALSNSLNVPAVKVLEYVGLENFYNFLEKDLSFKPIQPLQNYQLGIALGSLEMNLTDLAKYFTIFPNKGILKDLKIYSETKTLSEKKIANPIYIQLVNKILNDRKTGIEQFGLKSNLNLFQNNYALKTGTSRDFKDSWVIGFTPDFLVAVWVGNADNSDTQGVSGQIGAGNIWSEVMEFLLSSEYNKKTPFDFSSIFEFKNGDNVEYGLKGDNYEKITNILKEKDSSLILKPHDGDSYLLEENTKIILEAKEKVSWFIDGNFLGEGESQIFAPNKTGQVKIKAQGLDGKEEALTIYIQE
jgi:penicillin-binding protein 1C